MKKGLALVTGASGLVGAHLVRQLLKEGYPVRVLLMQGDAASSLQNLPIEKSFGNILEPDTLVPAMSGVTSLFHLAGSTAEWAKDEKKIYDINVLGVRFVMQAALSAGVKRVLHVSSCAAIGGGEVQSPADEESPYNFADIPSPYFLSKLLGEKEAMQWALRGLQVVVANPHQVIGAWDSLPSPTGSFLIQFAKGELPFYLDAWTNWVDARALAWGMVRALEKGRVGERYILAGEAIHLKEILKLLSTLTGKKAPKLIMPQPAVEAAAWVLQGVADHLTHQPPLVTVAMAKVLKKPTVVSSAKARQELGFNPPPIEEAMSLALDWFRKEGFLK